MPRNRSEKAPRIIAERVVKPRGCNPRNLRLKADGHGWYYVWMGIPSENGYVLKTADKQEALEIYDSFHHDFYFSKLVGWPSRWKGDDAP